MQLTPQSTAEGAISILWGKDPATPKFKNDAGVQLAAKIIKKYAPGQNPNGSLADIAGIANEAGNVMGLMPHPEHAVDPVTGSTDGGKLFESPSLVAA